MQCIGAVLIYSFWHCMLLINQSIINSLYNNNWLLFKVCAGITTSFCMHGTRLPRISWPSHVTTGLAWWCTMLVKAAFCHGWSSLHKTNSFAVCIGIWSWYVTASDIKISKKNYILSIILCLSINIINARLNRLLRLYIQ